MKKQIQPQLILDLLFWSFRFNGNEYSSIIVSNLHDENEQFELVKYLLNNSEIDFNEKYFHGNSMMNYAMASQNFKLIEYFSHNIDDMKRLQSTFFYILGENVYFLNKNFGDERQKSIFELVKYLVERGVNIHECDKDGANVLHLSAKFHSLKMIKYFISLDVDLHSLDHQNNTVLLYAFNRSTFQPPVGSSTYYLKMKQGSIKIIKYLIWKGINIEQKN